MTKVHASSVCAQARQKTGKVAWWKDRLTETNSSSVSTHTFANVETEELPVWWQTM
ncbi:hypothetical protein Bbelb_217380 [Branchiostoma belcheri]|nr:hypothetical protein Bbelb_217380 [Branchiostoma belcheri]